MAKITATGAPEKITPEQAKEILEKGAPNRPLQAGRDSGVELPTDHPHYCEICHELERLAAADERHALLQTELNTVRSAGSQARHEADALRGRLETATEVCQERTARINFLEAELDKLQKRLKRKPIKGSGGKPKPKPRKR